eukprot:CAMPEP_0198138946 /NCGR_PEP_ID=MMETSP1443-20131203/2303_1 /TAXON_ID=186043 /ORGANISM="Entomoneis sp., Strain CCMP2396" /LENGTH=144 /DNA_ID=CAMNT_0043800903 /DNA_START=74 /DNA_END=508 /DNA_ORIENTATION=+
MMEATQKLRIFFIAIFGWSLFFWAWALKNTIGMDGGSGEFDLGVLSFGTVLVSSSYMLGIIASGNFAPASKLLKHATTCSHVFVALNYLLGSYIGFTVLERPGFGLYCVAFSGLWLGIAYYGYSSMNVASGGGGSLSEHDPLSG